MWCFNPPNAPHIGVALERLVRAVKSALNCMRTERLTSDDLMRAILAECEILINSRTLTYMDLSDKFGLFDTESLLTRNVKRG